MSDETLASALHACTISRDANDAAPQLHTLPGTATADLEALQAACDIYSAMRRDYTALIEQSAARDAACHATVVRCRQRRTDTRTRTHSNPIYYHHRSANCIASTSCAPRQHHRAPQPRRRAATACSYRQSLAKPTQRNCSPLTAAMASLALRRCRRTCPTTAFTLRTFRRR